MSAAEIVVARRGHVLRVARRLDPELRRQAEERGIDVRFVLLDRWAESRESWALLIDGRAVAVGGWRGALLAGAAEAWLSATPEARVHRFALARAVIKEARRLADGGFTIIADVLDGDESAGRFAEWCGLDPAADAVRGMRRYELAP